MKGCVGAKTGCSIEKSMTRTSEGLRLVIGTEAVASSSGCATVSTGWVGNRSAKYIDAVPSKTRASLTGSGDFVQATQS